MEYDVLEESRHAAHNVLQNAWTTHKDQYITTKAKVEELNDLIDVQELKILEGNEEDFQDAQDELTAAIDDLLSINDDFNSSLITVDLDNLPANTEDIITVDSLITNE